MINNYDSLDDLEQAIADYERKYPKRKLAPWIIGAITIVAVFPVVFVIVAQFVWDFRMSTRVGELEETLAAIVIPPLISDTPTAPVTATLTFTPSATITNTASPTSTFTNTPTPSSTATPISEHQSGLVKISIWKELCPYNQTKYFDLPPVKIEVISPEWTLVLEDQQMLLKKNGSEIAESYKLDMTIVDDTAKKPIDFEGTWGKGLESARQLSHKQCGPEDMDNESYFWIPNAEALAAPQGRFYFQATTNGNAVSNETEEVSIVTKSSYRITVDKLFLYPSDSSDIACHDSCGDQKLAVCVMKIDLGFYAIQWKESRRLYWAKESEITDPPNHCNSPGVYTGITLDP